MSLDVSLYVVKRVEIFDANITHNLNSMAEAAGIYEHIWRPEELGIKLAGELIEPLEKGLELLRSDPDKFRAFEPENKWGTYDGFLPWIERYLEACRENPGAEIVADR